MDVGDNNVICVISCYTEVFITERLKMLKKKLAKKEVSIVIPTLNEEGSIVELINRIDSAMKQENIKYEAIIVDDNSKDTTQYKVKNLERKFPVHLHIKKGKQGKAYSLLEGFSYAKYDLISMIDADLQYPPETLKDMVMRMQNTPDIIVAERISYGENLFRKLETFIYRTFFIKFLHGIDIDSQSGLKIFKKEVVQRLTLNPSRWTFDLEFLVKAKHAGYSVETIDCKFSERKTGKTKIQFLISPIEMAWNTFKLKFATAQPIPVLDDHPLKDGNAFHHKGALFVPYTELHHIESALHRVTKKQFSLITLFLCSVALALIINWHATLVLFLSFLMTLYFIDLLFNLFLIWRSFAKTPEIQISDNEILEYDKKHKWPTYTILCPLYKEWQVIPQFIEGIQNLDYPKEKLQVLMLLEEDDLQTLEKVKELKLPEYFQIHVVPHSMPKTKPKACNYGLMRANGEYSVIFDAEDRPDSKQLKKTVVAFTKVKPNVVCIQAKLNFYNPHQNILTKAFTAEYSLWFDLVLTGLQSIWAPIPLGGTSNHFRTKDLIDLKGWDPFNVTEDCNLGVHLIKKGYKTAIVDSVTWEEANSEITNWYKQRTRWIKGYIQTYMVHMRDFWKILSVSSVKEPHFLTFQLVVGGKVASMFINPLMWAQTIAYFTARSFFGPFLESLYLGPFYYMGVFCLVFGNFLYMYYYMIACAKREQYELIKYVFFVPIYWLLISWAAWGAVIDLFKRPHYWAKTKHGLHLAENKAA